MKRVTATWTVITHPFACLAEIANPFERESGARSRADDGPSSALPGLFGGDRDPWRWQ
ncbi:hypothetical protein PVAP13_6NG134606 [Panicum virgatum]|uniref:Uncharacterized protein n=1 Tax=Panicum virgatum TaxID=38727 RepID=A0A8T0R003_PANVG|nr:hypothetical protein PVAP13_6NG134606 [Panicum virgatum]